MRTLSSTPAPARRTVSLRPSLPTFSIETCMRVPRIFLFGRLRALRWSQCEWSAEMGRSRRSGASPEPDVAGKEIGHGEPNVVRKERLELSRVAPLEPKSSASTSSATFARPMQRSDRPATEPLIRRKACRPRTSATRSDHLDAAEKVYLINRLRVRAPGREKRPRRIPSTAPARKRKTVAARPRRRSAAYEGCAAGSPRSASLQRERESLAAAC